MNIKWLNLPTTLTHLFKPPSAPPPLHSFSFQILLLPLSPSLSFLRPRHGSDMWRAQLQAPGALTAAAPTVAAAASQSAPAMPIAAATVVPFTVPTAPTPAPRRYATRVGPIPPSPPHPRPTWRAPPSKRARTSGPGESSSSRP